MASQFIPFGVYVGLFVVALPMFWVVLMDLPVETRVLAIVDDDGNAVGHLGKTLDAEHGEENDAAREIS